MNKARDLSLTIIFLLVSIFAFSATHKESEDPEETRSNPKYKSSSVLGLNLLDLFMLPPVKQDTTVIRLDIAPIFPEEEK